MKRGCTDRKYYQDSCAVIFDLPDLIGHLRQNIQKLPRQKWINWMTNKEKSHPLLSNDKIQSWFDLTIKGNVYSFRSGDRTVNNPENPPMLNPEDCMAENPLMLICRYLDAVKDKKLNE